MTTHAIGRGGQQSAAGSVQLHGTALPIVKTEGVNQGIESLRTCLRTDCACPLDDS